MYGLPEHWIAALFLPAYLPEPEGGAWGKKTMTPREALELLKAEGHDDHTLWRDPDGKSYILSRPGSDLHYFREG